MTAPNHVLGRGRLTPPVKAAPVKQFEKMKKRIVIEIYGEQRTVFGIWENPNNLDLNIHVTSGGSTFNANTLKELVAGTSESNYKPSEKHITIHNSPKSNENNVIKRTIIYTDSSEDTAVQVTSAIKCDNLYIPVLFRVCGDLSRGRYKLPVPCEDDLIPIGKYDPKTDQLRFMVVVSKNDRHFQADIEHPTNNLRIQFDKFSVTVLWSYLNKPSHPHAIDFFLNTYKEQGPIRGFDWWEIYNFYTDLYMAHANEYFDLYP
jgi:hypothetical protein